MTKEALAATLSADWPELVLDPGREWLECQVVPAAWPGMAQILREREDLAFDFLFCLTCVDWKTQLMMVYHLRSTVHRHHLVVKAPLNRETPEIGTVAHIWKTAIFHEREVFEMFGVQFTDHPDLRKLILPDDWQGYPLRKDYEDPVNMIKL